jgi:hypothetical protein
MTNERQRREPKQKQKQGQEQRRVRFRPELPGDNCGWRHGQQKNRETAKTDPWTAQGSGTRKSKGKSLVASLAPDDN